MTTLATPPAMIAEQLALPRLTFTTTIAIRNVTLRLAVTDVLRSHLTFTTATATTDVTFAMS